MAVRHPRDRSWWSLTGSPPAQTTPRPRPPARCRSWCSSASLTRRRGCAGAGLFEQAAGLAARLGGSRRAVCRLFVVVLAVLSTAVLSLDTTAVLLTPCRDRPGPHSTRASRRCRSRWPSSRWRTRPRCVLPVSNLTNLLAAPRPAAAARRRTSADAGRRRWSAIVVHGRASSRVRDRRVLLATYDQDPPRAVPGQARLSGGAGPWSAPGASPSPSARHAAPAGSLRRSVLLVVTLVRTTGLPVRPASWFRGARCSIVAALFAVVQTRTPTARRPLLRGARHR